ncbi:MAG: UDP-N-acetylmuramoyl-L-alanine--D-glutamate ligase [Gemmatimonadota bacterium]
MNARTVGVLGLARSGRAAARLALSRGEHVFASDAGDSEDLREAAAEIRQRGGEAETGGHSIERLAACDLIIVSPGIPPTAAVLRDERIGGVPVVSELEYAYAALAAPVIGVTGTNGKSTTTALTAHLLQAAEFEAPAAGNIGLALSEIALRPEPPDWTVVEASSFQLAGTVTFAPRIGVVTNLSPDHLDRYPGVEAYYADKARLFANASPSDVWVLNGEDDAVRALPGTAAGQRRWFRVSGPLGDGESGGYLSADGALMLTDAGVEESLVHVDELRVFGRHNHANALAASLAALAAGASHAAVSEGLRSFAGLEHRLERVAELGGVLWVNDSKATNVSSTRVALESMNAPVVLLLGGRHKGDSYAVLVPALRERARRVLAYGEAATRIESDLWPDVAVEIVTDGFSRVVDRAAEIAQPGDVVLLSPACSSFDMFEDYEDRGRRFRRLVLARMEVKRG